MEPAEEATVIKSMPYTQSYPKKKWTPRSSWTNTYSTNIQNTFRLTVELYSVCFPTWNSDVSLNVIIYRKNSLCMIEAIAYGQKYFFLSIFHTVEVDKKHRWTVITDKKKKYHIQ